MATKGNKSKQAAALARTVDAELLLNKTNAGASLRERVRPSHAEKFFVYSALPTSLQSSEELMLEAHDSAKDPGTNSAAAGLSLEAICECVDLRRSLAMLAAQFA